MGKTFKDFNPYKKIRIPVPRPGKAMPTERDYNRKRDKQIPEEEDDD